MKGQIPRGRARVQARLEEVYTTLLAHHGPQRWWPGETPFEVMVGAILTQNTAWTNVERAIAALKEADCLAPLALVERPPAELALLIRPAGYFNVKAARLQSFCRWLLDQGGIPALAALPTAALRPALLAVKGVGPETADDILLYALDRPVFVIDAYTRRLFSRLEAVTGEEDYEDLRAHFEAHLPPDAAIYGEYHALIVRQCKEHCTKRGPDCAACPLAPSCGLPRLG
jgi:endonuclease-3 related protein